MSYFDVENFSMFHFYHHFVLDGFSDWTLEDPALKRLYDAVLGTIDRATQQQLIRQMERHTQEHAYFLFYTTLSSSMR